MDNAGIAVPVDTAMVNLHLLPVETTTIPTIAPGETIPTGTTTLEPKPEIISQPIASITIANRMLIPRSNLW